MADDLESVLNRSPLTKAQKADLWDAYESAADDSDLAARLEGMQVPKEVKASLWDLKTSSSPAEDFGDVEGGSSVKEPLNAEWGAQRTSGPAGWLGVTNAEMATQGEADTLGLEGLPAQARGSLAGGMAAIPLAAPLRVAGAVMGGQQGYRKGGLPGAVIGAGVGAAKPQAVMLGSGVSDVVEMAGGGPAGALTAGVASLMLKRYGLGGVGKLLSGVFGSAEKAEAAVVAAAKTAPAAEKLAVARMTKAEATAALEALPKPSGADVQAMIPGGTRFTAEQTAGMVARARANEATAAARRAGTAPVAPTMPQEAISQVRTAPMPPAASVAPAAPQMAPVADKSAEILETVTKMQSARFGRGDIIKALKNGPMEDATLPEIGTVVDQLRKGNVVMSAYKGGAGRLAQPPQPGTAPEDLEETLRRSIEAYRMP